MGAGAGVGACALAVAVATESSSRLGAGAGTAAGTKEAPWSNFVATGETLGDTLGDTLGRRIGRERGSEPVATMLCRRAAPTNLAQGSSEAPSSWAVAGAPRPERADSIVLLRRPASADGTVRGDFVGITLDRRPGWDAIAFALPRSRIAGVKLGVSPACPRHAKAIHEHEVAGPNRVTST